MYFDEEIVLDARLNYLNQHVDYFIIIESCFTHRGDRRELNFYINKYKKFKDKIIYKVYDKIPNEIDNVFENDDETTKSIKYIMNALYRENGQRNFIIEGIKEANNEDLILVSDVDEIPNLSNIDLKTVNEKNTLLLNKICHNVDPSKDFTIKPPKLKLHAAIKIKSGPGKFLIRFIYIFLSFLTIRFKCFLSFFKFYFFKVYTCAWA